MSNEITLCGICDHRMKPENEDAKAHICATCLMDTQIGERL